MIEWFFILGRETVETVFRDLWRRANPRMNPGANEKEPFQRRSECAVPERRQAAHKRHGLDESVYYFSSERSVMKVGAS